MNVRLPRAFYRAGRQHWRKAARDVVRGAMPLSGSIRCWCGEHQESGEPLSLPRDVIFVYRAGHSALGSIDIRVRQMGSALRAVSSKRHSVRAVTEEAFRFRPPSDSDVIFSKTVLTASNKRLINLALSRKNRVWADFVDGAETEVFEDELTGYLCASRVELEHRLGKGKLAHYLPQQVDPRWPRGDVSIPRPFEVLYMGGRGGSLHLESLDEIRKEFLSSYETRRSFHQIVERSALASHHFSVRAFPGVGVFKPETKALVAARLGAVFVGSRADQETARMFSSDYPYLAKDSSLAAVREVMEFARETHLGPEWRQASAEMQALRVSLCDVAVGKSLQWWLIEKRAVS